MRWLAIIISGTLFPAFTAMADEPDIDRSHWAFQRPVDSSVPTFDAPADQNWVRNPVDAFVLARLKQKGLRPSPEANRRTLIRRLTFNLTGLPPTIDEIDGFINDPSPLAYERLVDRLLASPAYGLRWGQHWLDVVRFAETEGFEYDRHHASAWRFRDYVIDSLNDDKPYDQFVQEQIAGDELAVAAMARGVTRDDLRDELVAAGFHRLGPVRRNAGNTDVAFSRNEVLTERTNIIGAAFLGLTMGCARCHDHMFDPIPQKDYYRLQAFLSATFEENIPLAAKHIQVDWKAKSDAVDAEIKRIKAAKENASLQEMEKLRAEMLAAESRRPDPLPEIFTVRNDFDKQTPTHLLERGDERKKGELLGMRPPAVLLVKAVADLPAAKRKHPRTELARWLVSPENPMTARVMVNRIWQSHFGRGLVATPNDFGINGDTPSHPQLLDWLALRFMGRDQGTPQSEFPILNSKAWSIKSMHRLILHSSSYRQSSGVRNAAANEIDPQSRLLWRFNRRRLTAEELRDAMLSISGRLNESAGGPSIMIPVAPELIELLYKPSQWRVTPDKNQHDRRSIYLFAKRNLRLPFMEVFDQPDLQISCDRRISSTHAPQALEMLNGPLSNAMAAAFADRLRLETDPDKQIELAFRLTVGRVPTANEHRLSRQFLEALPLSEFALAMFNLNAFLYVD
jgi:hypothetical protein